MKNLIRRILDFVLPQRCVGCSKEGILFCFECQRKLVKLAKQECPQCRRVNEGGRVCCGGFFRFSRLIVTFRYQQNDMIQKLVKQFKYKFSIELARILRREMFEQLMIHFNPLEYILVPVPLDKKRLKERGFNQALLLAENMGEVLDCLARKVNEKHQAGLKRAERLTNVQGLFSLKEGFELEGKRVILIDDIATTGATLNECAKVLIAAGAKEVSALVLARGS